MSDHLGTFKTKRGKVTLTAATDEEVVEYLCGPWEKEGLNRFVPQDFALACRIHDEDYTTNPANITRAEADRRFLRNMLELAEGNALLVVMAYVFYAAVRLGGWRYWRGG